MMTHEEQNQKKLKKNFLDLLDDASCVVASLKGW
jgi:hypothetical protein